MAPVADIGRDGIARFIKPDRKAARDKVSRGRESDRAAADDGHRKIVRAHAGSFTRFFADGLAQPASTPLQQFSDR